MQRCIIAGAIFAGLVACSALVYEYERYYRGPKDTVLVGTWRGHYVNTLGHNRTGYRFKPDHTYEELIPYEDAEVALHAGRWYAGGDFIYLRFPIDDGSYTTLQAWHIDAMTAAELQIHYGPLTVALKRVE